MKTFMISKLSWFILFSCLTIFTTYGMDNQETFNQLQKENENLIKENQALQRKLEQQNQMIRVKAETVTKKITKMKQTYTNKVFEMHSEILKLKQNCNYSPESNRSNFTSPMHLSPSPIHNNFEESFENVESSQKSPCLFQKTPKRMKENIFDQNSAENKSGLKFSYDKLSGEKIDQLEKENTDLKNKLFESQNLKAFHQKQQEIESHELLSGNYISLIDTYRTEAQNLKIALAQKENEIKIYQNRILKIKNQNENYISVIDTYRKEAEKLKLILNEQKEKIKSYQNQMANQNENDLLVKKDNTLILPGKGVEKNLNDLFDKKFNTFILKSKVGETIFEDKEEKENVPENVNQEKNENKIPFKLNLETQKQMNKIDEKFHEVGKQNNLHQNEFISTRKELENLSNNERTTFEEKENFKNVEKEKWSNLYSRVSEHDPELVKQRELVKKILTKTLEIENQIVDKDRNNAWKKRIR